MILSPPSPGPRPHVYAFATIAPPAKLMLDVVGRSPLGNIVTNDPTATPGAPITVRLPTIDVADDGICKAGLPLSPFRPVIWKVHVVPAGTTPWRPPRPERVSMNRSGVGRVWKLAGVPPLTDCSDSCTHVPGVPAVLQRNSTPCPSTYSSPRWWLPAAGAP